MGLRKLVGPGKRGFGPENSGNLADWLLAGIIIPGGLEKGLDGEKNFPRED